MDYYKDIYVLSEIKRYSVMFTIRQESVAEHSFFVAAICMKLYDEYDFDLGNALRMAISHDMPEIELNDVPRRIKRKYPAIEKAFEDSERKVCQELPSAVHIAWNEYNAKDTIASKVVHLADVMQCAQYAKVEMNMGNTAYFSDVLYRSKERINELKQELEEWRR